MKTCCHQLGKFEIESNIYNLCALFYSNISCTIEILNGPVVAKQGHDRYKNPSS
jgi:hypothetical protein